MALPIILEGSEGTSGGTSPADDAGAYFELELWQVAGLDFGATLTRKKVFRAQLAEAHWDYDRIGGAGKGEFVVEGGVADMDEAVQTQWEIRLLREGAIWYRARLTAYEHFT